ncbi:MAG: pyridoxal-phosphate dependent enzyme [Bacteroidetes bacterium]|nr:pyridoxal-phosphate dependent enzyme [Bacteroidota bacterium]
MRSHRLPLSLVNEAATIIDPVFLHSPQFIHEPLSKLLGCTLILKIEAVNPIRCFKGRGADFLVTKSREQELVCASAGNFGQAMAYACRKAKKKLFVFASMNANPLKIERMKELGAEVILIGNDFDAAKEEARQFAGKNNLRFVEDGLDIETLCGAATIGLELLNEFKQLDAVLVPLGNGALLNGVARVVKEKIPTANIVAVQASGAPAMIESWKTNTLVQHEAIQTIADGIGVRVPIAQALNDMKGWVDEGLLVSENSILQAIKLLHQQTGLVIEPSGAVGIAALLENKEKFEGQKIATILCGGNMTEIQMRQWL